MSRSFLFLWGNCHLTLFRFASWCLDELLHGATLHGVLKRVVLLLILVYFLESLWDDIINIIIIRDVKLGCTFFFKVIIDLSIKGHLELLLESKPTFINWLSILI